MKKEIASPVLIAIISAVVIVVVGIGWFYLRPAAPERVPPRQPNSTRTGLLQQSFGQSQQAAPGGGR